VVNARLWFADHSIGGVRALALAGTLLQFVFPEHYDHSLSSQSTTICHRPREVGTN
jgi:hypothetical protein